MNNLTLLEEPSNINQAYENDFKKSNIFKSQPQGILLFDSKNNPFYPLDSVSVDTHKSEYKTIFNEYKREYGLPKNVKYLPWHYTIDMTGQYYNVLQTRPFNYRTPFINYKDHIAICVIGDSTIDLYTNEIYDILCDMIINPIIGNRIYGLKSSDISLINMGSGFDMLKLKQQIKK